MNHLRWTSFTVLGALMGCTTLAPEPLEQAQLSDQPGTLWRPQQTPFSQVPARPLAPATVFALPEPVTEEQGVPAWQGPTIVALASNVYELRPAPRAAQPKGAAQRPVLPTYLPPPMPAPAELQAPTPTQAGAPCARCIGFPDVKLEVSNGVGTTRLARRTAQRLSEAGFSPARLTNAPPYRKPVTRIEYLPGQLPAVQALAERLPMPVQQLQVARLPASMQIRLLLGHDQAGRSIASWAQEAPPHNASTGVAAVLPR
jgi:hypothetical protein